MNCSPVSSSRRTWLRVGAAGIGLTALHARQFTARVTPTNSPSLKAVRPPTSGPWYDVSAADRWRKELSPPTVPDSPMLYLLDLHDVHPTVAVLDAYLRNLATEMKAGRFGESAVVVSTQDPAVRRYVEMVALQEDLPIYLSSSTTSFSLMQAPPGARLSETERQTLRTIMELGGIVDARELARTLRLQHTTAINRLNSLESKGLLFKRRRAGRRTDLYVDFRVAGSQYSVDTLNAALTGNTDDAKGLSNGAREPLSSSSRHLEPKLK